LYKAFIVCFYHRHHKKGLLTSRSYIPILISSSQYWFDIFINNKFRLGNKNDESELDADDNLFKFVLDINGLNGPLLSTTPPNSPKLNQDLGEIRGVAKLFRRKLFRRKLFRRIQHKEKTMKRNDLGREMMLPPYLLRK
jgi:hypothetical protein